MTQPTKRYHRILGIIMLLPLLGWALTGVVFFIKPGYDDAYQPLVIKTYAIDKSWTIEPEQQWQDIRLVKTILGTHLLVTDDGDTKHLAPYTLQAKELPPSDQLSALIQDAISVNQARYGNIIQINDNIATTNTGVQITLDWNRLKLSQRGQDTDLIDLIYKIHYLQWTPFKAINEIVGFVGLFLLMALTVLGAMLVMKKSDK
ncbi:MAG: putative iron-regulated membrane protein [Pseudomonadales bacterium]|jgi:uncharacterized iron-regulated membrane protein